MTFRKWLIPLAALVPGSLMFAYLALAGDPPNTGHWCAYHVISVDPQRSYLADGLCGL